MSFQKNSIKTCINSPLGPIWLAIHDDQLVGVWLNPQRYHPDPANFVTIERDSNKTLKICADQLDAYFSGNLKQFLLPINLTMSGTTFQQKVWQALLTIPYGTITTYAEIAHACTCPKAVRSVGAAIGKNPLSIVVPCHRVIGKSGYLTGFDGGIELKAQLITLETSSKVSKKICMAHVDRTFLPHTNIR